jgi:hypothetical protein
MSEAKAGHIASPPPTYTTPLHIRTTQRDKKRYHQRYVIYIRDDYPHLHYKKTIARTQKKRVIGAFNAQKNALSSIILQY